MSVSLIPPIYNELIKLRDGSGQTLRDNPFTGMFPASAIEWQQMDYWANNKSVGPGGATWWVRPTAVGRRENGSDVVYLGSVTKSPSSYNRDLGAYQAGNAIPTLIRVEFNMVDGIEAVSFQKQALNESRALYRMDEHMQVAVNFNASTGELMAGWGARTQTLPVEFRSRLQVRQGPSLPALGAAEFIESDAPGDQFSYCQIYSLSETAFLFGRSTQNSWSFARATWGRGYTQAIRFWNNPGASLSYMAIGEYEPRGAGQDPRQWGSFSKANMFLVSHPTVAPQRQIRYVQGLMVPQGVGFGVRAATGGLYVRNLSTDEPPVAQPVTQGRLDVNWVPFDVVDADLVYECPVGNSVRVLDVQHGLTPRVLFAEFTFDWVTGQRVPLGTGYILKLAQYNWLAQTWSVVELTAGIEGALGYSRQAGLGAGVSGTEGYTSFYILGASFYRGKNSNQMLPRIYYADRATAAEDSYRLTELVLDADYGGVASVNVLLENQKQALFRPEMTLYGNKRILWYLRGHGWRSFEDFEASYHWLEIADPAAGVPVITQNLQDISRPDQQNFEMMIDAYCPTGERLTFEWEFSDDAGGTWAPSTTLTGGHGGVIFASSAVNNGRWYRCNITNSSGTTTSAVSVLTVV